MLGAFIGDIVGSRFEFNNHRSKEFELFGRGCEATDDSIMTLAVAKALMETEKVRPKRDGLSEYCALLAEMTVKHMQSIGRNYPNCGFGGMFARWVFSGDPRPYNSFGNGAAMRISPVAYVADTEEEVKKLTEAVTAVTHDHPEGIKGAEAAAMAVFMARNGYTKGDIWERINNDYYPLNFKIDDIRATYRFNETCQDTVPQAIEAFLESTSFEDAIRTAISVGGDSDTLAAITGAIAEAYYGVPKELKEKALAYLDEDLFAIWDEWQNFIGKKGSVGRFHVLTKYIKKLEDTRHFGEWIVDRKNDGTIERPIQMPFVVYDRYILDFDHDFHHFAWSHREYELNSYGSILERNGIERSGDAFRSADVSKLDEQCVLALIQGVFRMEHFGGGAVLSYAKNGCFVKWLKRLKELE